jgi:hypothetical protein
MSETGLTVAGNGQNAIAVAGIFKDINFADLNGVIDSLGNSSGNLKPEEKVAAVDVLNDWKRNVVGRLHEHADEMRDIIRLFGTDASYHDWFCYRYLTEAQSLQLVGVTGQSELFNKVSDAYNEYKTYCQVNGPEHPYTDDNMSRLEIIQAQKQYDLAYATFRIEKTKLERKLNLAFKEFHRAIRAHEQVKAMVEKAQQYTKNLNKFTSECENKASLAKLNVQISSDDVRRSLREIMDFAIKI